MWLSENYADAHECYILLKRGRPKDDGAFYYLDAVEEALCFGWIDSTHGIVDGTRMQRFTPRRTGSNWTELNKERVRRLERLGKMTDAGRAVLPDMSADTFEIDGQLRADMISAGVYEIFLAMPPLYQRVRANNLLFMKKKLPTAFTASWRNFVEKTQKGEMYGEWNDYGRLL